MKSGALNWVLEPHAARDSRPTGDATASASSTIAKKILVFATPQTKAKDRSTTWTPGAYSSLFQKFDIGLVIRLNKVICGGGSLDVPRVQRPRARDLSVLDQKNESSIPDIVTNITGGIIDYSQHLYSSLSLGLLRRGGKSITEGPHTPDAPPQQAGETNRQTNKRTNRLTD